ncbi:hypothetical protein FisN_13Hh279 [Fistulifera solaris]|uniref:Uncharacterized protein n=1 Tax=Fistulifera solaris TaxID=1519565 RepID=A0A1Z5KMR2_FISSO|nr:hypothetical protein FisN_13Hh279 [Fistulifera solaris]|eukprot:GAX27630.1 hypothetical protein FisN_13Hh279 [Fistulifera solaris]
MWKQLVVFFYWTIWAVVRSQAEESQRQLQGRIFDRLFPEDLCETAPGIYGPCDPSRFRTCAEGTLICYNRRPMRNKFYQDIRQPYYYIHYDNVFCYPERWSGCSSCAPGRYCLSEFRCILDDVGYPCEQWF